MSTSKLIIKVCGMRELENIREVGLIDGLSWMGFIFYHRSARCVTGSALDQQPSEQLDQRLPNGISRVGVFVNATYEEMLETAKRYHLDILQLHGNESPDLCYSLQKRGFRIVKAFSVATHEDLQQTDNYAGRADYFLFDTRCVGYGGSGQSFDWQLLESYKGTTPFLLSGGIKPESLAALQAFHHPQLAGIDLNSGFETAPALKDSTALHHFIQSICKLKEQ